MPFMRLSPNVLFADMSLPGDGKFAWRPCRLCISCDVPPKSLQLFHGAPLASLGYRFVPPLSDSAKFEQYIPDLENLFSGKAILERVHVKYSENNKEESDRAKRILKISGYHTVIIYVPSPYGNLESYRETEPEFERVTEQINKALNRTEIYQKLKIRAS